MNHPSTPLTNCHTSLLQFFVEDGKLNFFTYQRSCDLMLGVPHNLIQSWAFLMFMAKATGLEVGCMQWMGGDCHVYMDHIEAAKKVVGYRGPVPQNELIYTGDGKVFKADDFHLKDEYKPIFTDKLNMIV
jgi:thymidylate synthase